MPRVRCLVPALALWLAACAGGPPLGLTEAEWNALDPAQKLAARDRQATLDAEAAARRAAERRAAEERAAAAEAARQRRLDALRREARYGDVVQCVIPSGTADFRPGWREIDPVGVALVRSETRSVTLTAHDSGRTMPLWLSFSEDGLMVSICRHAPREQERRRADCQTFAGTAADYRAGLTGRIDLPEILKGRLRCAYAPAPGMPDTVILRREP